MRLLLTLVGAGVLVASASAGTPAFDRTAAGTTAATASLLTSVDLPASDGWSAVAQGTNSGFPFSCTGWDPSAKGVTIVGAETSPVYKAGGVEVEQMTNVYATGKQATTTWSRSVKPKLIDCVVETLAGVTEHDIDLRVLSAGRLPLKKPGPMTAGYRVVADLYSPKNKDTHKVYFDVIFVGRNSTLSELTVTSFASAVPSVIEYALAKIVYDRVG